MRALTFDMRHGAIKLTFGAKYSIINSLINKINGD